MCLGAKRSRDFFLDFSRCIIWCIDVFRRKNWPLGRRSSSHLVTGIVFPSCLRDSVCQVLTGLVAWNSVEPVWNCHFDMQKKMAKHCDYSSFSIFPLPKIGWFTTLVPTSTNNGPMLTHSRHVCPVIFCSQRLRGELWWLSIAQDSVSVALAME